MTLYPGPMRHGLHNVIQGALLWLAFLAQDFGSWLDRNGRRFEDWVAPSGRRAVPVVEPFWDQP